VEKLVQPCRVHDVLHAIHGILAHVVKFIHCPILPFLAILFLCCLLFLGVFALPAALQYTVRFGCPASLTDVFAPVRALQVSLASGAAL
jgi:hypothetical protein